MGLLFLGSDLTLYLMAIHRSLGKITTPLSHLPTWLFIIGYPLFWIELYTHSVRHGMASALSWVLFASVVLVCVSLRAKGSNLFKGITSSLKNAPRNYTKVEIFFWSAGFGMALFILGIVVLASLKPIHLLQEFDCLQYHYTLPRQHLI